jgi:Luciferase
MSGDQGDALWDVFVVAMLATGPAVERRSRYGDKPALFTASREFAHLEAPGVIDLRITRAGWSRLGDRFVADPAVRRDPSRRDWIVLHLDSAADLDRLSGLLAEAMAANA